MGREDIIIIKGSIITPFPQPGEGKTPIPIHKPRVFRKRGMLGIVNTDQSVGIPIPPEPPKPVA